MCCRSFFQFAVPVFTNMYHRTLVVRKATTPAHRQTFGDKTSHKRPFAALRVTLLESCSACHPEHSEGSGSPDAQILRCAQDDRHSLQMSLSSGIHQSASFKMRQAMGS